MSQENWERAEALMVDIETWNPTYAQELTKEHGKKGAIKFLKKFLDNNDRTKENLKKTLLEQMPKTNDPYQYRVQELQAEELATEMAQEEVRELYTPQETPDEDAQEFLRMLRMRP